MVFGQKLESLFLIVQQNTPKQVFYDLDRTLAILD